MAKHQTYVEENRIAGYFNYRYSLLVRAFAYSKNIKKSEAVVMMCRMFIDSVSESDQKRMIENYLKDMRLGEV